MAFLVEVAHSSTVLGPLRDMVLKGHRAIAPLNLLDSLVFLVEDGNRSLRWQLNLFGHRVRIL